VTWRVVSESSFLPKYTPWAQYSEDEATGGIPGNITGGATPDRATRAPGSHETDAFGIPLVQRRILDEKHEAEDIVLIDFVRWMQEKSHEHFLEVPGA
jgi:hypothetical protein